MHPSDRPQQFSFARQSAGPAPLRRPGSIRRTTSIDSDWPDGREEPWEMTGRARDLLTPADGSEPQILDSGQYRIMISPMREILSIEASTDHPRLQEMVGVRAGGASRLALAEKLGDLRGTPLYQVLDDFAGASLVARWIWSRWMDNWHESHRSSAARKTAGRGGNMMSICTGFAPGASSLNDDGTPNHSDQSATDVGPLENADDPVGWHPMPFQQGPQKRRSRRIDLWREGDLIRIDAGFQDSGSNPQGGRTAIHEYRLYAEADAASGKLISLQALPLILPFRECPGASVKASRMVGANLNDFRDLVLETLPDTLGCTHLNDVLRALADVPALARLLP